PDQGAADGDDAEQGGDPDTLERQLGKRRGSASVEVTAQTDGVVTAIDAYTIGMAGVGLGVGRNTTEDDVLPDVGFEIARKVGEEVSAGGLLCTVYGESEDAARTAADKAREAFTVGDERPERLPLIVDELSAL
ncbi:MAG: thymidine phosphorylase, partial [Spirochaetota bacterium]